MEKRIDDNLLLRLLEKGHTVSGMALKLGVDKSNVSRRLKALNIAINRNRAIRAAHKIVDGDINVVDESQKINRDANELLDLFMRWTRGDGEALPALESQVRKIKVGGREEEISDYRGKDPRELALDAMQEIREQLELQVDIFQTFYNMQAMQQFQTEVLEVIQSVSPEAGAEIIRRLAERDALRSALDPKLNSEQ